MDAEPHRLSPGQRHEQDEATFRKREGVHHLGQQGGPDDRPDPEIRRGGAPADERPRDATEIGRFRTPQCLRRIEGIRPGGRRPRRQRPTRRKHGETARRSAVRRRARNPRGTTSRAGDKWGDCQCRDSCPDRDAMHDLRVEHGRATLAQIGFAIHSGAGMTWTMPTRPKVTKVATTSNKQRILRGSEASERREQTRDCQKNKCDPEPDLVRPSRRKRGSARRSRRPAKAALSR